MRRSCAVECTRMNGMLLSVQRQHYPLAPCSHQGKWPCSLLGMCFSGSLSLSVFPLAGGQHAPGDLPTESFPLIYEWAGLLVWFILFPSWDLPGFHAPLFSSTFPPKVSGLLQGPRGPRSCPPGRQWGCKGTPSLKVPWLWGRTWPPSSPFFGFEPQAQVKSFPRAQILWTKERKGKSL